MNLEEIRDFCLLKKGVEEGFPFGADVLVFKVGGKMFLLLDLNSNPIEFNVKCDPEKAIELREKYAFIRPGFHMSKTHWNTLTCEASAPKKLLFECISDSYEEVVKGLPVKLRNEFMRQDTKSRPEGKKSKIKKKGKLK